MLDQTEITTQPAILTAIKIKGEVVAELPKDLYIPPQALEVFLEAFQGPLDLLLYLIRKQNIDILDIPIADITAQYVQYVDMMQALNFELAAEYLVMAAMLAEIKSRMLLPRVLTDETEEEDPRAELVRRLREYERFKQAAEEIEALPRCERDIFELAVAPPETKQVRPLPQVRLKDLFVALTDVLERAKLTLHHHVRLEPLSIRERMAMVLERVRQSRFLKFTDFFVKKEGRQGVVISFIAVLELLRNHLVDVVQAEPFGVIHVRGKNTSVVTAETTMISAAAGDEAESEFETIV